MEVSKLLSHQVDGEDAETAGSSSKPWSYEQWIGARAVELEVPDSMQAALEAMLELRPVQTLSSLQAKVVAASRDPLFCPAVFRPLAFQDALFKFASMKRLP